MNEKVMIAIVAEIAALKSIVLKTPELKEEFERLSKEKMIEIEKDINQQTPRED